MKVFSPGTRMSLACFCFEVIMAISSKNFAICSYWLRDEKKRNSTILRKYLATNMHQYMMVILSSWDLFALLSGNRTIAATVLCRVYTHVWSPIKVNYVDIKSSRSTENPEGFLHPPSPGIPTTLLSSLHCHHSTKLHTNTTNAQKCHREIRRDAKIQAPAQTKTLWPLATNPCSRILHTNAKQEQQNAQLRNNCTKKGRKFTPIFQMLMTRCMVI